MTTIEILLAIGTMIINILGAWGIFAFTLGRYQQRIDQIFKGMSKLEEKVFVLGEKISSLGERLSSLEGIISHVLPNQNHSISHKKISRSNSNEINKL